MACSPPAKRIRIDGYQDGSHCQAQDACGQMDVKALVSRHEAAFGVDAVVTGIASFLHQSDLVSSFAIVSRQFCSIGLCHPNVFRGNFDVWQQGMVETLKEGLVRLNSSVEEVPLQRLALEQVRGAQDALDCFRSMITGILRRMLPGPDVPTGWVTWYDNFRESTGDDHQIFELAHAALESFSVVRKDLQFVSKKMREIVPALA